MRFSAFLFLAFPLALASCAGPAAETYSYTPPDTPGGRLCTGQCQEARDYCREGCDLSQRACFNKMQAQALQDYDQYTRDQFASHQTIELSPHDFEYSARCDGVQKSCDGDCEDRYRMCYQNCGGKAEKSSSCRFLCF